MKKRIIEILILLGISMFIAFWYLNYFRGAIVDTIILPNILDLIIGTLVVFAVLAILVFGIKSSQKLTRIPDGHQKLYNERNQITKEGVFENGKLLNGSEHIYNKDGTLSHIAMYKNGVRTDNISKDKYLSADT